MSTVPERWSLLLLATHAHQSGPPRGALTQRRERDPERFRDFGTGDDAHVRADDGDERADDDRREHRRARGDVVERAEDLAVARDVDARLLPRLADRRLLQVVVARLHATTGTGDVAAPRIALGLGALDHQQLGLAVIAQPESEQHGGETRRPFRLDGLAWTLV